MKRLLNLIALLLIVASCNSARNSTSKISAENPYEKAYDDYLDPEEIKVRSWYQGLTSVIGTSAYRARLFYPEKNQITSLKTYKYRDREVLHGLSIAWSDIGDKLSEGSYETDDREGPWKFYSGGKVSSEGDYSLGQPDGLWKNYHSNGKLENKTTWRDGVKDGAFMEYDTTGLLINEGK